MNSNLLNKISTCWESPILTQIVIFFLFLNCKDLVTEKGMESSLYCIFLKENVEFGNIFLGGKKIYIEDELQPTWKKI